MPNRYSQRMQELTDFGGYKPTQKLSPLSEDALKAVESELGQQLPSDYREFLKDYGNLTVGSAIEFVNGTPDGPAYGGCEFFYGVNTGNRWTDLLTRYKNRGPDWPKEFLPISESDNGLMCLVIFGSKKGEIYFWHTGQGGGEPVLEHLYFVDYFFDEFINRLVK